MITDRENHTLDYKSLRLITGSTANFAELAQACVCFANGAGGTLLIGIEDDADAPAPDQRVAPALLDKIRKRVGELSVNVQVLPELRRHDNGGEYIQVTVPRAVGVASTSFSRNSAPPSARSRPMTVRRGLLSRRHCFTRTLRAEPVVLSLTWKWQPMSAG